MNEIRRKFEDVFVYAGITREEYQNIKTTVQQKDRHMLSGVALLAGIILLGLFCVSFQSATVTHNRLLYGGALVIMVALYLFSHYIAPKHLNLAIPACYVLLIAVYTFGIVLGTFNQPTYPATTFCVLLFAAPLLFTDRPYRMSLLLIAVTVGFCIVSSQVKPATIASLDRVNAISFLLLGIAANAYTVRVKMRDLVQRRFIERERDTDNLTQLMTKAATEREIQAYMAQTQEPAALLVIDIDDFKSINDTYGHAYGDAVIRLMGECIHQVFRNSDVLGRFGGDEFVLFLPHMSAKDLVAQRVERLSALMKEKITMPESARCIHGSIGIAFYPASGSTYQELFENADAALYDSKQQGKDRYSFYLDASLVEKEK